MSTIPHPALFDDLLDLLAQSADADRVLAFRLSPNKQARLDDLLEKNREGALTEEQRRTLERVAGQCLIHNTLLNAPQIDLTIETREG